MNTAEPIELLFFEYDADYDFSAWYFPDESKIRIYLNGHKYDTICVEAIR